MTPRDLNYFAEGSIVTIVGVSTMQKVKVERISDSGVTISGPDCGQNLTISGKSPAIFFVESPKDEFAAAVAEEKVARAKEDAQEVAKEITAVKHGTIKAKMNDVKVPDGQFSVTMLAELNGVPYPYAFLWVKDNCKEVGKAPREPGKRGRATTLYVAGK